MGQNHIFEEIKKVSLSMFRKNFFGVYHGSISARETCDSFIINKKDAILDEISNDSLISLKLGTDDYIRNISSGDTQIHESIYVGIPEAKYISYTMPPYTTAYILSNDMISPIDYSGSIEIGEIHVYDPGDFSSWHERAPEEIVHFFKTNSTNMMLIKGFGLVCYNRDIVEMAKRIALLENSARLLMLSR